MHVSCYGSAYIPDRLGTQGGGGGDGRGGGHGIVESRDVTWQQGPRLRAARAKREDSKPIMTKRIGGKLQI